MDYIWVLRDCWFFLTFCLILISDIVPAILIDRPPVVDSNGSITALLHQDPYLYVFQHLNFSESLDFVRQYTEKRFSIQDLYATEERTTFVNDTMVKIAHQLAGATSKKDFLEVNKSLTEFMDLLDKTINSFEPVQPAAQPGEVDPIKVGVVVIIGIACVDLVFRYLGIW
jgi:hypothetical protein